MSLPSFEQCAFVAVTTRDLQRVREFWCDVLGFPVLRADSDFVMIDAAGVRICFDLPDGGVHDTPGSDPVIGLKVRDLDEVLRVLDERGIALSAGPFHETSDNWAELRDPDGRTVILTERG